MKVEWMMSTYGVSDRKKARQDCKRQDMGKDINTISNLCC